MKTVKEVCDLAGVSRRTLHYYDDLGLLRPSQLTEAGYRLYDDKALLRLQDILLFKALDIPLKDIQTLLDSPQSVRQSLLSDHLQILDMKRAHLEEVIQLVRSMIKGEEPMALPIFNTQTLKDFQREAKDRWGQTSAYQAFESRQPADQEPNGQDLLSPIFRKFAGLSQLSVSDEAVEACVRELQATISQHFYPCDDAILANLGELYVTDERFTQWIDGQAGAGTASFVHEAILATLSE